jgi:uncharacterized membrane protein YvbJ
MSEPEIARRCASCGVSVRQHAMFCPQCGNPIQQVPTTTTKASDLADTIIEKAPPAKQVTSGRGEKLRTLSVVIDQAAYDPSLRFILVAAVLFVIFLVLLILSKVLG